MYYGKLENSQYKGRTTGKLKGDGILGETRIFSNIEGSLPQRCLFLIIH